MICIYSMFWDVFSLSDRTAKVKRLRGVGIMRHTWFVSLKFVIWNLHHYVQFQVNWIQLGNSKLIKTILQYIWYLWGWHVKLNHNIITQHQIYIYLQIIIADRTVSTKTTHIVREVWFIVALLALAITGNWGYIPALVALQASVFHNHLHFRL